MTLSLPLCRELETKEWDVVVIGGGPGGCVAAREAARRGWQTLLIEAKAFPRHKVCGGCLNPRALLVLSTIGLENLVEELHGEPIHGMGLHMGSRSAHLTLPTGLSVTRHRLDASLLVAARQAGVDVLTETSATVEPRIEHGFRHITLQSQERTIHVRARIVVCADGLLRTSLRALPGMGPCPAPGSRMGVGTIVPLEQLSTDVAAQFPREQITMVVGPTGYVGLSWAEADQLSIAAAVDTQAVKATGSPSALVLGILASNGILFPAIDCGWQGTPPLTTLPRWNAEERLFVIGDAAGYVEPFTGEGMAAALEQSIAVLPFVEAGLREWRIELAAAWQSHHRTEFRKRQRVCRMASAILRRRWLSNSALNLLRAFPRVAELFVGYVNRPSRPLPPNFIERL